MALCETRGPRALVQTPGVGIAFELYHGARCGPTPTTVVIVLSTSKTLTISFRARSSRVSRWCTWNDFCCFLAFTSQKEKRHHDSVKQRVGR